MPMQPSLYALDLTGNNPINRITAERLTSTLEQPMRSITPQYAPYFGASVVVYDASNAQALIKDVDYKCLDLVNVATVEAGAPVYRTLLIINAAAGPNFDVSYTTVGGGYIQDFSSIQHLLNNLASDSRPVAWPSIVNRPDVFDPAMHLHNLGEAVGFEYLVTSLETLKNAILMGDQLQQDAMLVYIDQQITALNQVIGSSTTGLLSQSLVLAQLASARSTAATATVQATQQSVQGLSTALNALSASVDTMLTAATLADSQALTLISQYPPAFNAVAAVNLTKTPSLVLETPVMYPPPATTAVLDTDWYALNATGNGVTNQGTVLASVTNAMMSITVSTQHDAGTGQARLNVNLVTYDRRATTLAGLFTSACSITMLPLVFEDDIRGPVVIAPTACRYNLAQTSQAGNTVPPTFQVVGVDPSGVSMVSADQLSVINKIASYLLDCKADYNVKGYGSVSARRSVTFNLPAGTELNMSFGLSALQAADIERKVSLKFRTTCAISTGARANTLVTNTVTANALEAGRIRCISASF